MTMFWLVLGGGVRAEDNSRVWRWKTVNGKTFRGRFVRLEDMVLIVARDGWEFAVPVSALSRKSLELARQQGVWGSATRPVSQVPMGPVIHAVVQPGERIAPTPIAAIDYRRSILTYCQDHIGERVGSGQCAILAVEALRDAGAAGHSGDFPGEGDYVWGKPVAFVEAGYFGLKGVESLARVEPGDIVQFHEARFSGFNHSQDGEYQMVAHHHTAVIESVDPVRRTISVLHQNWNGRQYVQRETLFLRGMTNGWLRFYRPVPTAG